MNATKLKITVFHFRLVPQLIRVAWNVSKPIGTFYLESQVRHAFKDWRGLVFLIVFWVVLRTNLLWGITYRLPVSVPPQSLSAVCALGG